MPIILSIAQIYVVFAWRGREEDSGLVPAAERFCVDVVDSSKRRLAT